MCFALGTWIVKGVEVVVIKAENWPPQHTPHHLFMTSETLVSSQLHHTDTVTENSSGGWCGSTTNTNFSSWATSFASSHFSVRSLPWLQQLVFCWCHRAQCRGQSSCKCSNHTTNRNVRQQSSCSWEPPTRTCPRTKSVKNILPDFMPPSHKHNSYMQGKKETIPITETENKHHFLSEGWGLPVWVSSAFVPTRVQQRTDSPCSAEWTYLEPLYVNNSRYEPWIGSNLLLSRNFTETKKTDA